MVITFFGHSRVTNHDELFERVRSVIESLVIAEEPIVFYCGGYGDFDAIALRACREIKKQGIRCEIVYVTPYLDLNRQKELSELVKFGYYDATVYPPIENVPPRYAILKRNEWMVCNADVIVSYVRFSYGGAYTALRYARRKGKRIIDLASTQ